MDRNQEINIEKDFWDDFIVEAFENIDAIEQNAMSLEQNPEDTEIIHAMFRAFHTVKGLAGFVEHVIVQEIAHKTETMMDYCRKGVLKVDTGIVNMILKASDCIKTLCNNIDSYKDSALMDNIEELLTNLENTSNYAESLLAEGAQVEQPQEQPHDEAQDNFFDQPFQEDPQEQLPVEVQEQTFEPANQESQEDNQVQAEFQNQTSEEGLQSFADEITEIQHEVEVNEQQGEDMSQNYENNPPQDMQVDDVPVETQNQIVQVAPAPISDELQQQVTQAIQAPAETTAIVEDNDAPAVAVQNPDEQPQKELNSFQKSVLNKLLSKTSNNAQDDGISSHGAGSEEYMKVANSKIDHLVDIIGELIINQALIEQNIVANYSDDRQLTSNMSGFLRVTRDLQNLSMSLRMVSLKSTFQKLARIARDTIHQLQKDVEFVMSGESTEIDRAVAERLLEPLVHMIKNAISHGVEPNSDDRVALGKPRKARVELNAYSKRGKIYIEVKDDGRGINTEVVYKKALEKGLIDPNKAYSEAEIKEFIMLPGFSTASVVDNISGRGVGMDVVHTQIQKAGGRVEIVSDLNVGSTFILEVPVNHSIMNGTIIEINDQQFVVPTINVKEFFQPKEDQWIFTKQERTMIRVRDNIIPMVPLSAFFGCEYPEPTEIPLVMVLELEQELRAIPIVDVINRQEVVVKPVGEEFQSLKYISGMSILGSGNVSLILDIDYLFKKEVQQ